MFFLIFVLVKDDANSHAIFWGDDANWRKRWC